jgi:hypothetical protein
MTNAEMLTAGLALLGGYLGYRQWRNAKNKIRIDLYPKRIEVFRCTEEFLNRAWTGNYVDQVALLASFYHCKREARFLFDKKLADYLESLYTGVENHFHYENRLEIEGETMDFETKQMVQHQCWGSRAWLGDQTMHIKEKFAKYLDLSKIK